jgi:hypothetical protein
VSGRLVSARSIDKAEDAAAELRMEHIEQLSIALRDTNVKVNACHPGWVKTDMGGEEAPMEISEGAETAVWLATLPTDGPTGGFFHKQEPLPW